MNRIGMIVTDLDRTLLRDDKIISEYSKAILKKCHEIGIVIAFATARPKRATNHLLKDIPISYVIANNGATVVSDDKCIKSIPIPNSIVHKLVSELISIDSITGMTVEVGEFLYTNYNNHQNWSRGADWNPVITDFSVPVKEEVTKISVECQNHNLLTQILSDYPELYLLPNSGENWCQIMDCHSSKMNAITFLSEQTGIMLENIIAFGDDYNDIEMLQQCGIGVAVKNAVIDAKQVANTICDSNNNDGVAKYLDQYLLTF
jgi:5-amino-6-(5-phospho-D-ribitylamino)uracil phosphatase